MVDDSTPAPLATPLRVGWPFGALLVLASSAIVLVSEVVAARVIAPYVGVTLESFSAVIGCVLLGISLGSWMGGALADRLPTRGLLVGSLVLGGVSLIAAPYITHAIGPHVRTSDPSGALALAAGGFLVPSIALSTITPTVLRSIGLGSRRLGSVAGAVSGIGTLGALLGTFGAGFVLVGTLRAGQILVLCGATCLLLAATTAYALGTPRSMRAPTALVLVVAGLGGTQVGRQLPCDAETKYVCLNIDESGPSTFLVRSNVYFSSVTDVADPLALHFDYVRDITIAVEAAVTLADRPLRFGYVGGGGYTLPLYFEARYPQSSHLVYEIDAELVEHVTRRLGIEDRRGRFPTRIGDARTEVAASEASSLDVVVGDAFSGISVPWHLTTVEFLTDVRDVLGPGGIYVMNLIDAGDYRFARAQARTFLEVFDEVTVVVPRGVVLGQDRSSSNVLVIGGADIPAAAVIGRALRGQRSTSVAIGGRTLSDFIGEATVLSDDFAPVDQLLER